MGVAVIVVVWVLFLTTAECSRIKTTKKSLVSKSATADNEAPASGGDDDEKPDASCSTLATSTAAAVVVPIPGLSVIPGAALAMCCPSYVKEKYNALVKKAKGLFKSDWEKFAEEVAAQTDDDEKAEQRLRDSILKTYDLKGLTADEKERLEDKYPWVVYPKLVELYRFWPIDLPGLEHGPCSERLEQKLIEMRKEYDFLPGLKGGRRVIDDPESARPLPDALNDEAPSPDTKLLKLMLPEAHFGKKLSLRKRACKKIANGFAEVANRFGTKMSMEVEDANRYRAKFCSDH